MEAPGRARSPFATPLPHLTRTQTAAEEEPVQHNVLDVANRAHTRGETSRVSDCPTASAPLSRITFYVYRRAFRFRELARVLYGNTFHLFARLCKAFRGPASRSGTSASCAPRPARRCAWPRAGAGVDDDVESPRRTWASRTARGGRRAQYESRKIAFIRRCLTSARTSSCPAHIALRRRYLSAHRSVNSVLLA